MKKNQKMIFTAAWLVLGAALMICGLLEVVEPYWSGLGGGLLAAGILQTVRHIRYHKDPEYREAVNVKTKLKS